MKRNCGLYYKHVTIVNYTSSGVNKLKASLNDDTRVVIYDRNMFIVQPTGRERGRGKRGEEGGGGGGLENS
jgi:hypothetical protein